MFISNKRPETHIEVALERALSELANKPVDSAEYAKILAHVEKLHRMKEEGKPDSVKKDTWVLAGANLVGILLIINHEHLNPITTKAMSFVGRR